MSQCKSLAEQLHSHKACSVAGAEALLPVQEEGVDHDVHQQAG